MINLQFLIKLDGTNYDITSDVLINTIQLQDRSDLSLERGGFDFVSSTILKNIPPYTYCRITETILDSNEDEHTIEQTYLISSEANINLITKKAYHTCKLLDTKAILECYVVGSKTNSVNCEVSDFNFLKRCYEISIPNGSGLNVTYTGTISTTSINDYTFGTGTTLYDVFRTVTLRNNWDFNVSFTGADVNQIVVTLKTKPSSSSLTTTISRILQFKTLQDSGNYSKHLVTEANNVVDRAQETRFIWLKPRSNSAVIKADSAVVKLPIKVEAITSFKVYGKFYYYVQCQCPVFTWSWMQDHGANANYHYTTTYTLQEWINLNVIDEDGYNVFYRLYLNGLNQIPNILNQPMRIMNTNVENGKLYLDINTASQKYEAWGEVDYTDICVDEEYYNALDPREQPHYVCYKSGSDEIINLNADYRNDFWGNTFFQSEHNFLSLQNAHTYTNTIDTGYVVYYSAAGNNSNTNADPMDFVYTISCIPITAPKLIDTKNFGSSESTYLVNETSMKPMTRTYQMGDSNSLPIDFKLLYKDMDEQNETLGRIEAVMMYDSTGYYSNSSVPKADMTISSVGFDNNNNYGIFYISSVITRYTLNKRISQINLSKTRNKIADAIGVQYQYNSTKYAMKNVVDRPLYFELKDSTIYDAVASENNLHLMITFKSTDGSTIYNNSALLQRAAVMKPSSGNELYLYCEAVNNYVWYYQSTAVSGQSYRLNEAVKYCSDKGEVGYVSVSIMKQMNYVMEFDEKYPIATQALPLIGVEGTNYYIYDIVSDKYIAKDERERLSFTIKIYK